jgi:hypothetical protein
VPLGRDVARRQGRLGAFLVTLGRARVDAVLAFVQQSEQPGRLDVRLGPDAELG